MIHTTARTDVIEVTFIPEGYSEPETNTLAFDQFVDTGLEDLPGYLLDEFERAGMGEVISIIYVKPDGRNLNLYGARRYGL